MPDPFDTLGLPPKFDLSESELSQRQRALSRAVHPDRHAASGASQRRASLGLAMDVNQAVRALKDPLTRAEVLLRRWAGGAEVEAPAASPALLMNMMEARERLQESRSDASALAPLAAEAEQRWQARLAELSALLSSAGGADKSPGSLSQASAVLAELRYIKRFRDEVRAAEEDLL